MNQITESAVRPPAEQCPVWCTDHYQPDPADVHGFDYHRKVLCETDDLGKIVFELDAEDVAPVVLMGQREMYDADEVRALAEALARGADLMDQLNNAEVSA